VGREPKSKALIPESGRFYKRSVDPTLIDQTRPKSKALPQARHRTSPSFLVAAAVRRLW
jgi:hypothetical protein